ncbi:SDR family NAD(P)-dependent oxidoreductase [Halobaculum sp. MBLA0147]|uniref:SDR family NAD(P)-dependent oxidoreductase n=1 Tax=Halobaculum sp. MBLA0147 TaxID=3079934 RepID=UPI003525F0BF
MRRFEDAVALVTGSTHGIGLAIARRLDAEGASVVVNDEGAHDGPAVAAELADAIFVEADVSDAAAVERLVEEAVAEYGRVDVLCNVVGDGGHEYLFESDPETWRETFDTSVRSAWLATKHALPAMPGGGSVVNVSSTNAARTVPNFFPYNVAKSAVDGLTRAMAVELGPLGITTNAVQPGAIYLDDPDDEELRQDPPVDPLGRWGRPEDVAGVVAFLASDDAAYVTGVSVPVDAGRSAALSQGQQAGEAPTWDDVPTGESRPAGARTDEE